MGGVPGALPAPPWVFDGPLVTSGVACLAKVFNALPEPPLVFDGPGATSGVACLEGVFGVLAGMSFDCFSFDEVPAGEAALAAFLAPFLLDPVFCLAGVRGPGGVAAGVGE